jgi:hypothetical protein
LLQAPAVVNADEALPVRLDRYGDRLPPGALACLGTVRFNRCDCAMYAPDGKTILTGDRDRVHVCDAGIGKKVRVLPVGAWWPVALIFSHERKKLATASLVLLPRPRPVPHQIG